MNDLFEQGICPTCGFETGLPCPFCDGEPSGTTAEWFRQSGEDLEIHLPPGCMARYEEIKRLKIQQELLENQREIDWNVF